MNAFTKLSIATAAAALFSVASVPVAFAAEEEGSVKCSGINACKGQSGCKTAESACAGQNSCKGKGWIKAASAEECESKGGTAL